MVEHRRVGRVAIINRLAGPPCSGNNIGVGVERDVGHVVLLQHGCKPRRRRGQSRRSRRVARPSAFSRQLQIGRDRLVLLHFPGKHVAELGEERGIAIIVSAAMISAASISDAPTRPAAAPRITNANSPTRRQHQGCAGALCGAAA